ncbi:MAG: hypothetical protein RMA76_44155 [Deltaproteobacteria bacterium]
MHVHITRAGRPRHDARRAADRHARWRARVEAERQDLVRVGIGHVDDVAPQRPDEGGPHGLGNDEGRIVLVIDGDGHGRGRRVVGAVRDAIREEVLAREVGVGGVDEAAVSAQRDRTARRARYELSRQRVSGVRVVVIPRNARRACVECGVLAHGEAVREGDRRVTGVGIAAVFERNGRTEVDPDIAGEDDTVDDGVFADPCGAIRSEDDRAYLGTVTELDRTNRRQRVGRTVEAGDVDSKVAGRKARRRREHTVRAEQQRIRDTQVHPIERDDRRVRARRNRGDPMRAGVEVERCARLDHDRFVACARRQRLACPGCHRERADARRDRRDRWERWRQRRHRQTHTAAQKAIVEDAVECRVAVEVVSVDEFAAILEQPRRRDDVAPDSRPRAHGDARSIREGPRRRIRRALRRLDRNVTSEHRR